MRKSCLSTLVEDLGHGENSPLSKEGDTCRKRKRSRIDGGIDQGHDWCHSLKSLIYPREGDSANNSADAIVQTVINPSLSEFEQVMRITKDDVMDRMDLDSRLANLLDT